MSSSIAPAVAGMLGIGAAWATERRTRWRLVALTATLLATVLYTQRLLFGATATWWIVLAAACAALALAWAGRPSNPVRASAVLTLTLVCLLAVSLVSALEGVRDNVSDTNRLGVLHAGELQPLSAYLRAMGGNVPGIYGPSADTQAAAAG